MYKVSGTLPSRRLRRALWDSGFEELFFAIDHGIDVVSGKLEAMAMGDRVGRAGLDTISAENASRIVDVVDGGVAFGGGDALGFGILGRFDVDATGGTSRGTEKTGDTFFQAILIAVQYVNAAIARLKMDRLVRIILGGALSPKVAKGDAEASCQSRDRAANFFYDRSHIPGDPRDYLAEFSLPFH